MRTKDEIVTILLQHSWGFGKILPFVRDVGNIEIVI